MDLHQSIQSIMSKSHKFSLIITQPEPPKPVLTAPRWSAPPPPPTRFYQGMSILMPQFLVVIAEDPHGAILKLQARIAPKLSPLQAETMALHWVVQLAIHEKWSHIQFKGDSKVCYEAFLANGPCSAQAISHFVSKIRDLALCFMSCNFLWACKSYNSTTHTTAKFALASNESCFSIRPIFRLF